MKGITIIDREALNENTDMLKKITEPLRKKDTVNKKDILDDLSEIMPPEVQKGGETVCAPTRHLSNDDREYLEKKFQDYHNKISAAFFGVMRNWGEYIPNSIGELRKSIRSQISMDGLEARMKALEGKIDKLSIQNSQPKEDEKEYVFMVKKKKDKARMNEAKPRRHYPSTLGQRPARL